MRLLIFALFTALIISSDASAGSISIVAAENFYGDLAEKVAGPHAHVISILSNPDQDPHLFEIDARTAKVLADARVVISNGADYDPWMGKLLDASQSGHRSVIVAADLVGKKAGDNPHLWYDPAVMMMIADKLAAELGQIDPPHRADYEANARAFIDSLKPLTSKIAAMKKQYGGTPVKASEPVFGYMAGLLGLDMQDDHFQTAVMNNTEPSPADVAAFEDDLRSHKIKVMIYNSQADGEAVRRLVSIAKEAHVPVVGVTETKPGGTSYEDWMAGQLTALDKALASDRS